MSLLTKLLQKRGIEKEDDLSLEEKAVFDGYKFILHGDPITVDVIKEFCDHQVKLILAKFAEGETKNDTYYKACLHVYLNVLKAIEAPEVARVALEQHLIQLITK